jgi:GcrA cell cycle regulator
VSHNIESEARGRESVIMPTKRWHPSAVAQLETLVSAGLSAAGIANEMQITRNAVIGKCYRLGLELKGGRGKADNDGPKPKRERKHSGVIAIRRKRRATAQVFASSAGEAMQYQPKQLLELTISTCRFPVGDPQDADFFFCGAPPFDNLPYCFHHCRIAYQRVAQQCADVA